MLTIAAFYFLFLLISHILDTTTNMLGPRITVMESIREKLITYPIVLIIFYVILSNTGQHETHITGLLG